MDDIFAVCLGDDWVLKRKARSQVQWAWDLVWENLKVAADKIRPWAASPPTRSPVWSWGWTSRYTVSRSNFKAQGLTWQFLHKLLHQGIQSTKVSGDSEWRAKEDKYEQTIRHLQTNC